MLRKRDDALIDAGEISRSLPPVSITVMMLDAGPSFKQK